MKIILDNLIVKLLVQNDVRILKNPLISNEDNLISLRWSSLLEYLGFGSLLSDLPKFDASQALFVACISTLSTNGEKEVLFYLFDRLFTESLNQVRALPQVNAVFLHQAIKGRCEKISSEAGRVLSSTLADYEMAFVGKTADTMHDLILSLAWDRMCVWMANLFNHQSTNSIFIQNLEVLKGCLIESFLHIAQKGKTVPSVYRMIEALFFYQMREENLQKPTAAEWALLSQSFPIIKGQDGLMDIFYIDDMVASEKGPVYYLTLEGSQQVGQRLALAHYMVSRLKAEVPEWKYDLQPQKIAHL